MGLYDTVGEIVEGKKPASAITGCWQALEGIQDRMVNFLENHDEQRVASDFFAVDPEKAIPALYVSALMNRNPFMLYFGEEIGEPGMNEEGFSGKDGRTSIFDYCSLDTMIAWNNNGKWNEQKLTKKQKSLRKIHKNILNFCNDSKAISEGDFYDIMYVNYNNPDFDTNILYAFLRRKEEHMLLIVANFSAEEFTLSINIPVHLFDFWMLKERNYNIREIFSIKLIH